jgi:hypothetical protein
MLAAETAATVTVLAFILRVTVMAAAVAATAEVVAAVAAAVLRVRMGPPKQAAELDPHKPVDPDPGRA